MSKEREELLRGLEEESRKSTLDGVYLFQAVAERSGMNLTDLQCLAILSSEGPVTAGRLAEEMGLTTGAVTGLINRMERAGYVRREKDPADGRRVVVRPVPEELERAGAGFFASQSGGLEALTSEYDDRDLETLLGVMRKANAATRAEIARIRAGLQGGEVGEFSSPLGSVKNGRLVFANGASQITLRAGSGTDDLYRARFEGAAPKVTEEDGVVTVRYGKRFRLFDRRGQPGEVTLNPAVPWEIEVRGGAYEVEADLSGLELASFTLSRGFSNVKLTLPEPAETVPIRLSGGASKVSISRPAGTEARVTMKGGASALTFDEQSFDAVGGRVQLQSPGYDGTTDRYDIEISGGASEITIE